MTEHPRLLVPLDGSEVAEAAIPYAEALAHGLAGELRFLAVVGVELGGPFALAAEIRAQLAQDQQRYLGEYLEVLADQSRGRGIPTETATAVGDAAEEIVAAATPSAASMVVMATHGRGGLQRLFLGSVADKVMRTANCPTLLVTPREDASVRQPVSVRRITVPLDGSALAEAALTPAITLAQATGAELLLVRVESWLLAVPSVSPFGPDLHTLEHALTEEAQQYLEAVRARLPDGVVRQLVVLQGSPTAVVLNDYLNKQAVDLVVLTTHGRGGLRRFVLGSTADRLVRLGAPMLLIRPTVQAATNQQTGREPVTRALT